MEYFVEEESIVRKIWGKSDTILFIFAGASAEFALNKAVDWLYFTGKLPSDPVGRLFSTVMYARQIVFSSQEEANKAIDKIHFIHSKVESARESSIPEWAYRDVLFMLIYYSIAAYELLEKKLTDSEKEEVHSVFYKVGCRMGLKGLPPNYTQWLNMRKEHLKDDLQFSNYTITLYKQYNKALGNVRYKLLKEAQKLVVPQKVKLLLNLQNVPLLKPVTPFYKLLRKLKLDWLPKLLLFPSQYKTQIKELDIIY
jgi:hypothetical protein